MRCSEAAGGAPQAPKSAGSRCGTGRRRQTVWWKRSLGTARKRIPSQPDSRTFPRRLRVWTEFRGAHARGDENVLMGPCECLLLRSQVQINNNTACSARSWPGPPCGQVLPAAPSPTPGTCTSCGELPATSSIAPILTHPRPRAPLCSRALCSRVHSCALSADRCSTGVEPAAQRETVCCFS